MISTFIIEVAGAIWMLFRYKQTTSARLITALLACLAVFQFAEYMVCEGALGLSSLDWARIGYMSISLLPALGMHLAMTIAKKPRTSIIRLSYGLAFAFSAFFLLSGEWGVKSDVCMGNYVIFEMTQEVVYLYALYYYSWLIIGMTYAYQEGKKLKDKSLKSALFALSLGYFSFIFPTTLVNILNPATLAAIPSIMCGFAVLLALILLTLVAPAICVPRSTKS